MTDVTETVETTETVAEDTAVESTEAVVELTAEQAVEAYRTGELEFQMAYNHGGDLDALVEVMFSRAGIELPADEPDAVVDTTETASV